MDRKTVLNRKKLGLDVPEEYDHFEEPKHLIPTSAFVIGGIVCFLLGIYCLFLYNIPGGEDLILLWFAVSFFVAPTLIAYPILRALFGRNGVFVNGLLSAIIGLLVNETTKSIIKKIDK